MLENKSFIAIVLCFLFSRKLDLKIDTKQSLGVYDLNVFGLLERFKARCSY